MTEINDFHPIEPPANLLVIGTGTGKSREAREQAARIVPQLPEKTCLAIAAPTHALNNEHLDSLRQSLETEGLNVAVYRGRNADDPNRPGSKMCDFAKDAAELASIGGDPKQLCSRKKPKGTVQCTSYDTCGYRRQNSLAPSVWIVPHALLGRAAPSCIPTVAALIVDEDPLQTFLSGFGRPVRVSLDELRQVHRVPVKPGSKHIDDARTADLEHAMAMLRRALPKANEVGQSIPVTDLANVGITSAIAHEARLSILQAKRSVDVSPDMSSAERQEVFKEAAIHNRPILRLARLWRLIGQAISRGRELVPGCRMEWVIGSDGSQHEAVRMRWLAALNGHWHAPTMILSATARPALLKAIWPQVKQVAEIDPIAPHARVRQIVWSASRSKLRNQNHLDRLKRYIEVRAFEFRGQGAEIDGRRVDVLVIAQIEVEEELRALSLPQNVDTAHFNAVEGIDKWGGVACLISIGRTMASPEAVELMAEVLTGAPTDRGDTEFPNGWYPREMAGIRISNAGESGHPTLVEQHPDTTAEAVRWGVCEAGLIQAIGRGRAVNRSATAPLQIDIVSTVPLPISVDEIHAKDAIDPTPFEVMAARGMVIDEKAKHGKWAVVRRVLMDMFDTEQAARHALTRSNANYNYILVNERVSNFTPASIKLKDARYAVPVWIDTTLGESREVAERLVGPLAKFEARSIEEEPVAVTTNIEVKDKGFDPAPLNRGVEVPSAYPNINAILEEITGGAIPEPEDWLAASRIWMEGCAE